ncbi:MAG: glutamine--fructose-6-phosphate transaminase (isomerizing) [bacterium]
MCGIIAYAGHRPAVPIIVEGLKLLEYRGYDSSGVAFAQSNEMRIIRAKGKLAELEKKLETVDFLHATSGIGHTRWATHGLPSENNAHPHCDNIGELALVHNGIIENYHQLKEELIAKGHHFSSETDTEVIVHLIAEGLKKCSSIPEAMSEALSRVEGSYAVAVVNKNGDGAIHAARHSSPLVLGIGTGEHFLASDIPAFLSYTREVVFLEDGELVTITPGSWEVRDVGTLAPKEKEIHHIQWDVQAAQKGGYRHFMIKEIFEQPKVITDCLAGRLNAGKREISLPELEQLPIPERLVIVACGTSYHAGLWGAYLFEEWAEIPVHVEIASEFRYRKSLIKEGDLVMVISQSGETADTLAGLRLAREKGATVLGLCNVVGSTISRESDLVLYTQAGPEISVASTKAMCSQITMLLLLALYWGRKRHTLNGDIYDDAVAGLSKISEQLEDVLPKLQQTAEQLARKYSEARSFFYLGRGLNFPLALEGALKLKEISYIHAEGYAAGEMKHGPIALIDPHFPTFALSLHDDLFLKVKSNLEEVQARDGRILALVHPGLSLRVDDPWEIPEVWGPLNTFLILPALQLFAYEMAVYLGRDVDQPRNLAKSVTVE